MTSESSTAPATTIGTAEAKRRFSELVDRVGTGERILVSRRGRPAVALVPPDAKAFERPGGAPRGLATLAGALGDWENLDSMVDEIYAARKGSRDRSAPDLG